MEVWVGSLRNRDLQSNVQLDDVLIAKHVVAFDRLAVELGTSPDLGRFQTLGQVGMNLLREVEHRAALRGS